MTHRLARLTFLAVLFVGCGTSAAPNPAGAPPPPSDLTSTTVTTLPGTAAPSTTTVPALVPDLALVGADGRVASIRDGVADDPVNGLVAADDATLIEVARSDADPDATTVIWRRLADGGEIGRVDLAGTLTIAATDATADIVALTRPNPLDLTGTEIVVASAEGEVFRQGYGSELLPEGFADASLTDQPFAMFVIEYLEPPTDDLTAPRRYRVRVLDLTTGVLDLPYNLRIKGEQVDEDMLGFSRTHIASRANGLLFTLYRGLETDESQYAFVHTLGFVNGVVCLALPSELWLERLPGAMTLTGDESILIVASANGYVTEFVIADILDPMREPLPRRTEPAWSAAPNAPAPAMSSNDDTLLVGQGHILRWIDPETLTTTASATIDIDIESVELLDTGDALVAGSGVVALIDPSGETMAEAPVPADLGSISRIVELGDG